MDAGPGVGDLPTNERIRRLLVLGSPVRAIATRLGVPLSEVESVERGMRK